MNTQIKQKKTGRYRDGAGGRAKWVKGINYDNGWKQFLVLDTL